MLLAVFDACQVLTWKGNGGLSHRAIMSSNVDPHPSQEAFNVGLGRRQGGGMEWGTEEDRREESSVAGPALGYVCLGG